MTSLSYIERFRQTQIEIKRKNDFLLIGIDISKNSSIGCFINSSAEIYNKNFKFSNTYEGITKMLIKAESIKEKHKRSKIIFAVEPTGNYHKPICNYLHNQGYFVCFVSTVAAKQNRQTINAGRWRKNDPEDAYNIADLLKQGKILYYELENNLQNKQLIELVKSRKKLSKKLASIKAAVRNNIFAIFFPEIDELYKEIDCLEILTILKHFPTAEQIRQSSFQNFYDLLINTGNKTSSKQQRIYNVWNKAQNSLGCSYNQSIGLEISFMLENIQNIKKQIKIADKEIQNICQPMEAYKLLIAIHGFGAVYASSFLAVVEDIKKFKSSKQIIKLAGLDLEYCQSGNFHGKSKVSKKGNALLRSALSGAAKASLRNPIFKNWYLLQLDKKGYTDVNKKIIKTKLAIKMAKIAFSILTKNEKFNEEYMKQNSVIQPVHIER